MPLGSTEYPAQGIAQHTGRSDRFWRKWREASPTLRKDAGSFLAGWMFLASRIETLTDVNLSGWFKKARL